MRIVYMGAPDFAAPALGALVRAGFEVAAVVTQPDRPKGRGKKVAAPPVKEEALRLGLPLLQPLSPKDPDFVKTLAELQADVFAVIAYGHILSKEILALPRIMAVNIHASLLPKHRGPAPIQWAIINGDRETGVTAMVMDAGMDTGDILAMTRVPIQDNDTSASLHDRLALAGSSLLLDTLQRLDSIIPQAQDHAKATYARALAKEDGRIDWTRPAAAIERLIRGVTPWPGAYTHVQGKRLKILEAFVWKESTQAAPGTVLASRGGVFLAATGDGVIHLSRVQGANGKPMDAAAFLHGARIEPGTALG